MNSLKVRYILYLLIFPLFFYSCNSSETNKRNFTYFGGEIVNPNTNYVILQAGASKIDTIYLDNKNRFLHKIDDPENGFYTFLHKPEFQTVLIEKGDSIMVRLNTYEFDESLVYSGDGAKKNNFLIDMYLLNENEWKNFKSSDLNLPPILYKIKQDSLLKQRRKNFEKFQDKNNLSDLASYIIQTSYEYSLYSRFEFYVYQNQLNMNKKQDFLKELPKSFFDYRTTINLNDLVLKRSHFYRLFLEYYIINITNSSHTGGDFENLVNYTIRKMNVVDSLITVDYSKNRLLKIITRNFFLKNKKLENSDKVLNSYLLKSTNIGYQKEMIDLSIATARLLPESIIPDQQLINAYGATVNLSSLLQNPYTAIYFWSMKNKDHHIKAHRKAFLLGEKYPYISFYGINIDDNQTENWLRTLHYNRYKLDQEYEFKNPKFSLDELIINYKDKVIFIDKSGKIIDPNANLFSTGFEKQLIEANTLTTVN